MIMVHAARSWMAPALVKARHFSSQWLIGASILVEEWHAIYSYTYWPQGSWLFNACFSRIDGDFEGIGKCIDGIGILHKYFPSKSGP